MCREPHYAKMSLHRGSVQLQAPSKQLTSACTDNLALISRLLMSTRCSMRCVHAVLNCVQSCFTFDLQPACIMRSSAWFTPAICLRYALFTARICNKQHKAFDGSLQRLLWHCCCSKQERLSHPTVLGVVWVIKYVAE